MKFLTVIFSIYIFALSIYPCGDGCAESVYPSGSETAHVHVHEHMGHEHTHDHEEGEDDCSPFCSCDCCGIHIDDQMPTVELPTIAITYPEHQFHYQGNTAYYHNTHWWPPRV